MKILTMLVGPPGSGKSTMAKQFLLTEGDRVERSVYINQDSQGKLQHMENFRAALREEKDIIVDRMNFNKNQRAGYLEQAKKLGYKIVIHVIHESYETCFSRMLVRKDHETIKDDVNALQALTFFFKNYERVEDWEADEVVRHWPNGEKPSAIVCDLDGTLCNIEHRRHWVRGEGKKNWVMFMQGIPQDKPHQWCIDILYMFSQKIQKDPKEIVLCSGRGEEQRKATESWLNAHLPGHLKEVSALFMRQAGDSRKDSIVKEMLLDFEILTRYTPYLMIDDRQQVVDMWRKRGFTCLQCDVGDF